MNRIPRHSVGILVDAKPVQSARLVQPWQRARLHFRHGSLQGTCIQIVKLFKTMLNNTEMSLLKADMDISALYVDLNHNGKLAVETSRPSARNMNSHANPLSPSAVIIPAGVGTSRPTGDPGPQPLCRSAQLPASRNASPPAVSARPKQRRSSILAGGDGADHQWHCFGVEEHWLTKNRIPKWMRFYFHGK